MNSTELSAHHQKYNELEQKLLQCEQRNAIDSKLLVEEVRQLSAQVRELEKDKSAFLSNVRNEINNPLTSILGLAESIGRLAKEPKIKNLGLLIHQQAFALDFQMRNIIMASEIETGDIKPMISSVQLACLLESQIDYLSQKIESSKVMVKLAVDGDLYFPTDSYLLQAICINLLANAIEYSGRARVVNVKAWLNDRDLMLSVTDFGDGIPAEMQSLLFKRFKQLDSGLTKLHGGQGLGLAVVHELVGILNGSIELDSVVNSGTSITVKLPAPAGDRKDSVSAYGSEVIF